jgi:hypothetical protein
MARSSRRRGQRAPGRRSARSERVDALAAATIDAAVLYWRWLGEEFPRYAKAVSSELSALKNRPVGAKEAALRIARLTQEYTDVLGELPRRLVEQVEGTSRDGARLGRRRRQGRVID